MNCVSRHKTTHNKMTLNPCALLFLFVAILSSIVSATELVPANRRPFPAASIVAASIVIFIVLMGFFLAVLLALPRCVLFFRERFGGEEEEEEEQQQEQKAQPSGAVVSISVNNSGTFDSGM